MNWSLMHTQQRSIISIAYHLMLDNLLVEAKRKNCNFFSMRSQCEKSNLHFACIFMRDETFIFLIDCNLLNVCTHGARIGVEREKSSTAHRTASRVRGYIYYFPIYKFFHQICRMSVVSRARKI